MSLPNYISKTMTVLTVLQLLSTVTSYYVRVLGMWSE